MHFPAEELRVGGSSPERFCLGRGGKLKCVQIEIQVIRCDLNFQMHPIAPADSAPPGRAKGLASGGRGSRGGVHTDPRALQIPLYNFLP